MRHQTLQEGDRVLVPNLGITGKHKLQDRWNSLPYVVTAKLPNLPVYRVKPGRETGIVKTVHRDHLLPIGYLAKLSLQSEEKTQPEKPMTRAKKAKTDESQIQDLEHVSQEDWSASE